MRSSSNRRTRHRPDYRSNNYFESTPENNKDLTIPRWVLPVSLVVMGVSFIGWFFTSAPALQVKDIIIDGEATDESRAAIEQLRGQNILWLSVTRPESVIRAKQPSIKQIQILRGIPDTLRVKLIERQPALVWQTGESWYTLDPTGFVFQQQHLTKKEDGSLDYPGTDLPVVVDTQNLQPAVGQFLVRPLFVGFVRELKERLPKEFNLQFVRAEIGETSFNVTVVTDAGWNIRFDTTRRLDPQLRNLAKVLETKRAEVHEYIDVRVRGWVYYK